MVNKRKLQPLRKKKQSITNNNNNKVSKSRVGPNLRFHDEDIESSDDDNKQNDSDNDEDIDDDDDEYNESAEQKRKRLAKSYLASMGGNNNEHINDEDENEESDDDNGISDNIISERLRRNRLESQGKYFRNLSKGFEEMNINDIEMIKMNDHNSSVTCVTLTSDDSTVYSGSKDNSVIRLDVQTGERIKLKDSWSRKTHPDSQSHLGEILAVTVSTDGKYVVSGGRDKMIRVYDSRTNSEIKTFQGHRDAISSLAFRRDSYSLYSGSFDRCLKHWDLGDMGYIETMFGHQDIITDIDCWTKEKPISCSNDRTLRYWKVSEDTHLVYRGHQSCPDNVRIISDESFLSSGQDGSLCLWKESQKKPTVTIKAAHGIDNNNVRWISSLGCVKMSDIVASGSYDGYLKFWSVDTENNKLKHVTGIPVEGFINSIAMSPRLVVVGTGREHKFGRWWCLKGNKNKVIVAKLPGNTIGEIIEENNEGDDSNEDNEDNSLASEDIDSDADWKT
jgi:ribosomal RNA-processing protein 9